MASIADSRHLGRRPPQQHKTKAIATTSTDLQRLPTEIPKATSSSLLNIDLNSHEVQSLDPIPYHPRPLSKGRYRTDARMASKALIPILVTLMLATGVCNTLLTKYQVSPPTYLSLGCFSMY